MLQISQLKLPVDHTDADLREAAALVLGLKPAALRSLAVKQRAIDARRGHVMFSLAVLVEVENEAAVLAGRVKPGRVEVAPDETYRELDACPEHGGARRSSADLSGVPVRSPASASEACAASAAGARPVIVGTGPCGLFCGLLLARAGLRPILLERGKAAGDRARDVTGFWNRGQAFNPESNVQFGEGGAGTFSDGKLYTQIRDREHRIPWLLRELVRAGAPEDILIKARPHIGTDRLIKVVRTIREEIISLGGEVRFESRVTDVIIDAGVMRAVVLADGGKIESGCFVFAIGHSARDTFEVLHARGVPIEAKPFSIGVRIEHPQRLIDRMLYGQWAGDARLGSAPYKFVAHCGTGRSAYSFCMCPGGLVVASSSEEGGVVTNGMSSYARAEANANSGFMVEIRTEDFGSSHPLAGIELQRKFERAAFQLGGGGYRAPAQLLGDFLAGRTTREAGKVQPSYRPGVEWVDLRECLPPDVTATLKQAVAKIDRTLPGFALPDAVLTGVETRSSSPIRIPRDPATLECASIRQFYPSGEGAGYAGGIISAAADGMRVAEAVIRNASRG
ncbi:MAG: hypothetical protein K1X78_17325 [Verrucomicrobiaceae bacterium]|nr:hypothetical protein [Verrucomicrobiaceae bacterium]